ncbi:MAG: hypothetical protein J5757_06550 [Lachnospiraceae bacterium]|nr:hypothetical protein [Lachnospiraceae bacterium]
MKKRSSMFIRVHAALMTLLLVLLSLPVVPAQAVPAQTIEDHDDISVLSVSVNVNTETGMAFTELILKNNGAEDKEIEVTLPEISAGIDFSTLTVKTTEGQEIEAPEDRVKLDIKADGYAGVSYTYKAKKNLAYESVIAFDLKQLSEQFNDRIGHLEWTVDMPMYELVLVNDIRPVNYTVTSISTPEHEKLVQRCLEMHRLAPYPDDYRISILLDDFRVSRLLKNVYISRMTQTDLLNMIEDETDEDFDIYRLIYKKYRDMFHMDYYDPQTLETIRDPMEVLQQLYWQEYPEKKGETIPDQAYFSHGYTYFEYGISSKRGYAVQLMKTLWNKTFERFVWDKVPGIKAPALDFTTEPIVYAILPTSQPELNGMQLVREISNSDWFYARWDEKTQKYIHLKEPEYSDELEEYISEEEGEYILVYTDFLYPTDEMKFLAEMRPGLSGSVRYAYITFSDSDDPEILRDYLNAIHADAVVRMEFAVKDGESGQALLLHGEEEKEYAQYYKQIYGEDNLFTKIVFRPGNLTYSGTEEYPFDSFMADLHDAKEKYSTGKFYASTFYDITLISCEEPLKNSLSIPIFTQYIGYALPVEEWIKETESLINYCIENELWSVEEFGGFYGGPQSNALLVTLFGFPDAGTSLLEYLRESPNFQQMLQKRDAEVKQGTDAIAQQLEQARAELKLADSETMIREAKPTEASTESQTETEAPTEATSEDASEVTTSEEPTETFTEAATESSTEALTEATAEVSTEASTAAISSETETFASKDTQDPADKGPLVLLIAIIAGVVVVGAATAAMVIKKKGGNKTSKN